MRPNLRGLSKRAMDIALASAALPLAAPVVLAVALATVVESPGNPFFLQPRVGRDGQRFTLYKLRTMIPNAQNIGAGLYNEKNDPRYTQTGKLARRLSLDEVPQLLNVLKGDMSIVGPRPQLDIIVDAHAEDYREILQVKPGLTGLAQVSGRNALPRSKRIELDRAYARTWSIRGDIAILAKTIGVVLRGEGQLNDQSAADVER